jgi:hypothetical protein
LPGIYTPSEGGALRQGELITGLVQIKIALELVDAESQDIQIDQEEHPFAIVLSQDCDLEQDWQARQIITGPSTGLEVLRPIGAPLPAILFAQVHDARDLKGRVGASNLWQRVRQNKDERYHFLETILSGDDAMEEGLPELGIDFKRYFTLPTEEVYKRLEGSAHRRCRLRSPYLEHLSTRFCYYQFRVALPFEHQSLP